MCVAHPHPQCRFKWVRLGLDFTVTDGAVIRDMSPREVVGEPVEVTTKVGVGLKFEAVAKVLSAEIKPEVSSSRTVYYPKIRYRQARSYWRSWHDRGRDAQALARVVAPTAARPARPRRRRGRHARGIKTA